MSSTTSSRGADIGKGTQAAAEAAGAVSMTAASASGPILIGARPSAELTSRLFGADIVASAELTPTSRGAVAATRRGGGGVVAEVDLPRGGDGWRRGGGRGRGSMRGNIAVVCCCVCCCCGGSGAAASERAEEASATGINSAPACAQVKMRTSHVW